MSLTLFRITGSGIAGLAFAAIAFWFIPVIASSLWLNVFTSTACFALAMVGVSFLYARLGMVSLTQVGLMGIGGWVMLRVTYANGLPFEFSLLIAGFVTMVFGLVLALPALRLRGLYLALVTLMAAGGLEIVFATFQFPNGGEGFWGVQTGLTPKFQRPVWAVSDADYLRYTIVFATCGFLLVELISRLTPGRAWALIRRSEAAAMAAGVDVTRYKMIAFGISGLLAGVAGALLAGSLGLLDGQTFRASESILLFALAVVGGARYWLGVVIAAALFRILPALLNNWGVDADLSFVIFGIGLLHAVITAPDGIAGQLYSALRGFRPDQHETPVQAQSLLSRVDNAANTADVSQASATTPSGVTANKALKAEPVAQTAAQNNEINIKGVSIRFGGLLALDDVSARFTKPVSGIIGPNGAGKTTLMNVFSGFIDTHAGGIESNGESLAAMAAHKRGQWGLRRSFQREEIATDMSVADNVLVQLDGAGYSASEKRQELDRVLRIVGLADKARIPGARLNSFERRLTDLAKCIVGRPRVILLDEPAGGLSIDETRVLGNLILDIHRLCGAQTVVIDHDVDLIARVCDETLVLDFGKRIAFGPTHEVLADARVKSAYLGTEAFSETDETNNAVSHPEGQL